MLKFHVSLSLFLSLSLSVNQADGNHEADDSERAYCFLIDRAISYGVQKTSLTTGGSLSYGLLTTCAGCTVRWPDVERRINADLLIIHQFYDKLKIAQLPT